MRWLPCKHLEEGATPSCPFGVVVELARRLAADEENDGSNPSYSFVAVVQLGKNVSLVRKRTGVQLFPAALVGKAIFGIGASLERANLERAFPLRSDSGKLYRITRLERASRFESGSHRFKNKTFK